MMINRPMMIEQGRPSQTALTERPEKEIRCYDYLDALNIKYERTDHPNVPGNTMEICKEIDAILGAMVGKNLFLTNRQHSRFYLLIMPGDKVFKTKELSAQIQSSRLSFGSADEMEKLLDCNPGSASLLGLMNDTEGKVQLLVDEDILKSEFFGCHPCINTTSLKMRTADAFETFLHAVQHSMQIVHLDGAT